MVAHCTFQWNKRYNAFELLAHTNTAQAAIQIGNRFLWLSFLYVWIFWLTESIVGLQKLLAAFKLLLQ